MRRMSKRSRKKRRGKAAADEAAEPQADGGKPQPAAKGDAAVEADEPEVERTGFDSFRENAEALVVAIILAVIIRHFAVEAFEIPTGSMATTLYGMHALVDSPACDAPPFAVGLPSNSSTNAVSVGYREMWVYEGLCGNEGCRLELHSSNGRSSLTKGSVVECSACGTRFHGDTSGYRRTPAFVKSVRCPLTHVVWDQVFESSNYSGGHKILVNKFAFQLGKPERFDVGVFGFDQWKNYIKRLIGLPGEHIVLFDGDVYVDGDIVRKSITHPDVQDALWRQISDSTVIEYGLTKDNPAWSEPAQGRNELWQRLPDGRWSVNVPPGNNPAVLVYSRKTRGKNGRERETLDDYLAYNLLGPAGQLVGRERVGDVKLAFDVQPARAGGWIGAEIRDGDFTFQLRLPLGKATEERPATIERLRSLPDGARPVPVRPSHPDADRAEKPLRVTDATFALPVSRIAHVEFENVDDTVTARVDGTTILQLQYTSCPDPATTWQRPASDLPRYLWILAGDAQADVGAIRIWRDTYYRSRGLGDTANHARGTTLGPDQYWFLGDNSPSSSDGRYWGSVPEKNLMGKALLVFWPAWWYEFECKFIR